MARRADAERSRRRILDAARAARDPDLGLNELARRAGVGVGTVYRHFPTPHALREALALAALEGLRDLAAEVRDLPPGEDLAALLRRALEVLLADPALQPVFVAPDPGPEVAAVRREVVTAFGAVLARARAAGAVRAELTTRDLQHLVCGIEHAVRLGTPADAGVYLDVLLAGIRPTPGRGIH